ncbi:ribosome biogenesis GTPase Der [Magnetospira sp. QH-2]|uniref:ribosome biogenesis GTPase Der n=1 Tax=Magnetospira sp. (strain QH-2) TaxID=1288970 RepID=UPI0003E80CBA|nr:ribosome biogenesis GTPase Der [Magnetospira sp. QH-2]CCQ74079.1 GTP-binding protein, essential for cell growth [Magnetospira sp. QH-2]
MPRPFTLAIIGRPNVGKSTLFNRLVGKKLALVDDTPGVTRDRREGDGRLAELRFRVLDTAGLEDKLDDSMEGRMRQQTEAALEEADVILFLFDARAGITPLDAYFADHLRSHKTPVILVANKCEGKAVQPGIYEAYNLGLGDPLPFSAEHGEGMNDLYEFLAPLIESAPVEDEPAIDQFEASVDEEGNLADGEEDDNRPLQMVIVGRPNVGKSTLVNRLLGEERMLTGPEAGLTRDSIAIPWSHEGRPIKLIDTAGIRRRAKVQHKLEKLSVADSLRAVRYAQIVLLLIDAERPMDKQDLTIARQVIDEGRALILGINKWDAVADRTEAMGRVRDKLETSLPQVRGIPVVTFSAKTGRGVDRIMPAVIKAYGTWNRRIATAPLNHWLADMTENHPPPLVKGRRLKLRYMTQAKTRPPTFVAFASLPEDLPESYTRYLVNGLREDFDMPGVPIRFLMRKGKNPYAKK